MIQPDALTPPPHKHVRSFQLLEDAALRGLAGQMLFISAQPGAVIIARGQGAHFILILRRGIVQLSVESAPR